MRVAISVKLMLDREQLRFEFFHILGGKLAGNRQYSTRLLHNILSDILLIVCCKLKDSSICSQASDRYPTYPDPAGTGVLSTPSVSSGILQCEPPKV